MRFITSFISLALLAANAVSAFGQTAYGFMMGDRQGSCGFVHFDVNDPGSVTLDKKTSSMGELVSAAEQVGDTLYAFRVKTDGYIGLVPSSFVAINPQTAKVIKTISTDIQHRVVDMTYDYTTNTMYALVEDGEGEIGEDGSQNGKLTKTSLNIVDLKTGGFVKVGDAGKLTAINGYGRTTDEILVSLAADSKGNLYAMGDYRQFYNINKRTGAASIIGTQKNREGRFSVAVDNVFQSMSFDSSDHLWWSRQHPDLAYLTKLDPTNAEWNTIGHLQNDGQITGLHFVKPFDKSFPSGVTDLLARRALHSASPVNVSWTNPATNFDGEAASPDKIYVYRLGTDEPLAILDGTATSFSDDSPVNGVNVYEVQAVKGSAFSRPALASALAGYDTLESVRNVKATIDGNVATVTWDAPTSTVNGGYADYDHIVYGVYRIAGYSTIISADTTTELAFNDTIKDGGTYYYAVIAFNHEVPGVAAYSNDVTYATTFSLPYYTGFEDDEDGTLWTMVNKDHPSTYGVYGFAISPTGYASSYGNSTRTLTAGSGGKKDPVDDWAFSPEIKIPAGRYVVKYSSYGSRYAVNGTNWQLMLSKDLDTTTTKQIIESVEKYIPAKAKVWDEHCDTFDVAESGVYRIAFHAKFNETYTRVYFDSLSINALTPDGIKTISSFGDKEKVPVAYYTIDGRRTDAPDHGIFIIRFSDGTYRKVMRK